MKKGIFLALLVSIGFLACNEDPLPDPVEESYLTVVSAKANMGKEVTRPLKLRSSGTFSLVESTDCGSLLQYKIEGQGNATHLGNFTVELNLCTNWMGTSFVWGKSIAANGDVQYFHAVGAGSDENGDYTQYEYDGGTGRFEDLTGELKLYYRLFEFTSTTPDGIPLEGIFENEGIGTLTY